MNATWIGIGHPWIVSTVNKLPHLPQDIHMTAAATLDRRVYRMPRHHAAAMPWHKLQLPQSALEDIMHVADA